MSNFSSPPAEPGDYPFLVQNERLKDVAEDIRDGAKAAVKDLKEAGK